MGAGAPKAHIHTTTISIRRCRFYARPATAVEKPRRSTTSAMSAIRSHYSRPSVIALRTRHRLERRFWSGHARSLHREIPRKVPPLGVAAGNRPRIRRPAPESAALYYRSGTHTLARRRPGARQLPPDLLG